jgi:hypothetical protein
MIGGVLLIIRLVLNDTAVMSSEDVKKCYVGMSLSTKVLARFVLCGASKRAKIIRQD